MTAAFCPGKCAMPKLKDLVPCVARCKRCGRYWELRASWAPFDRLNTSNERPTSEPRAAKSEAEVSSPPGQRRKARRKSFLLVSGEKRGGSP